MHELNQTPLQAVVRPDRQKKAQTNQFIFLLLFVTTILSVLSILNPSAAWKGALGLAFGFVLHRARFCFAAAFRDYLLFGDTGMARALFLLLGISTIGFAIWQALDQARGNVYLIHMGALVGAFLFGVGMVLAGGCATSVLMRLGEGLSVFVVALFGMVAGLLLGAYHYGWWNNILNVGEVYLPYVLGWPAALIGELSILGGLYWWLTKKERQQ